MDTRKCQESGSLPVTGDPYLRWFSAQVMTITRHRHVREASELPPLTVPVTPLQSIANR